MELCRDIELIGDSGLPVSRVGGLNQSGLLGFAFNHLLIRVFNIKFEKQDSKHKNFKIYYMSFWIGSKSEFFWRQPFQAMIPVMHQFMYLLFVPELMFGQSSCVWTTSCV